ncbi:hypothetical protein [Streptomyces caatingaensis]|uniref:Sporulation delaying protein family toxin n=1 Tax=Streptomyces caatingaensis TaxID=1678637 RepID=A0A0K9XHD5_9ACTN|nr:hypothetical protein [Streptomyces caatingaensis]KNB52795.1 hypothetical protein AC230_09125 [Streptomyces caatingaensis]
MNSKRIIAAVTAVAALGVGGLTTQSAMATPSSHAAVAKPKAKVGSVADGRDLFAGVFFLQGDTGKALTKSPYFKDPKGQFAKNNTAEGKKATARILDRVAAKDPKLFATLSTQLRSGDPRKVEAALERGGKVLASVIDRHDIKGVETGAGVGQCAVAVAVAFSVAAGNLGAAVNVVVGVNVLTKVNFWFGVAPTATKIEQEKAVADLTKRLAAA